MTKIENYPEEIQEDSLSPYERWEMCRFGFIIRDANPDEEDQDPFNRLTTAEEVFLFNNEENPNQ